MKPDRLFHSTAAALILCITLTGFIAFYTHGRGEGGRVIDPAIMPVVITHGMSITAWYLLSLVQALLIAAKNRRLHMALGWGALALLPVIAVSGVLVAVRSARQAEGFVFFGMNYQHDFLLVMLTEITVFTALVTAGLLTRKSPEIHRGLMLSASLSLLIGATTRIPPLVSLFGGHDSRTAFFGPVFVLGGILLGLRWLSSRKFDRGFAVGFLSMVAVFLVAEQISRTSAWRHMAAALLGT